MKVLLVLGRIAETEGIDVPESEVEAEIDRARERYRGNAKLLVYFESERGRNFIRSSLRRTQTVEKLVDDWLAAHPDHPPIPHAEAGEIRPADEAAADAAAAVDATGTDSTIESVADDAIMVDTVAST